MLNIITSEKINVLYIFNYVYNILALNKIGIC